MARLLYGAVGSFFAYLPALHSPMPLTLRHIGIRDYTVLEDGQRIGRIRYASERTPGVWLWNIYVHVPDGLPIGSEKNLDSAKAAFKLAWDAFKAKHGTEVLERAYKAMNIRDGG